MILFYYPNLNIHQYEKKFISKLVVLLLGLPFLITCMLEKEVVKWQIGENEVWLYDLKDLFKTENLSFPGNKNPTYAFIWHSSTATAPAGAS